METRIERALITGASAGLGAVFARALDRRGVALTLVARRADRLEALAAELAGDPEILPADLADPDERGRVEERLAAADAPVDLLVNNAGYGAYGTFVDLDLDRQSAMLDLNVTALLRCMHVALRAQRARGRGGVINVASTAAFQPDPHGAAYGASKAFVRSVTEAVAEELRHEPVRVMVLCPGFTETEFQQVAGVREGALPGAARMRPEPVVERGLRDFARGRTVSVPGALNGLAAVGADVAPSAVSRRLSGQVHRRFSGTA